MPRPAATVVLLRPAPGGGFEVLLTQRPSTMAFAPDVHVFPGGAIDPDDDGPRGAALRELAEEAGVLLTDPSGLVPLARWVTPPFVERRFDVHFFAAELPAGTVPVFSPAEVVNHRWLTPRQALDAMAAGEIDLWVPTSTTLQQLEHVATFKDIASQLRSGDPAPLVIDAPAPGIVRLRAGGAGAVPGQVVNTYLVGRRELVVVDPGDPSDEACDAVAALTAEGGGRLAAVVLTSAAPDHAAGTEALIGRFDHEIPVFGGPGAGHDLPFEVVELGDGDGVPAGDVALMVMAAPGPRTDHVALLASAAAAAFSGDLLGPGPRHSILPAPDSAALATSRARFRRLADGLVLGGHDD
jgi:glyoxylase-like metal-dependent hydrolase (beta-lactamase superfamily II)/8-oxo-dGTP pyrophosphatase MutT (NUDIX family)